MPAKRPTKIESVLLYDHFTIVDPNAVLERLNAGLADPAAGFRAVQVAEDWAFAVFAGDGLYAMISQTDTPLAIDGFAEALRSPHTAMTFPKAREIVTTHKQRILVTVGCGVPMPGVPDKPDIQRVPDDMAPVPTLPQFETMLSVCQTLTTLFFEENRPLAIHWGQSDQILDPELYDAYSRQPFPIALFVHPGFFSSRTVVDEKRVVGLRTFGAAPLIGREIVFAEAPVPPSWIYKRTCDFVAAARKRGALIPDGENFGASEDEIIRIRHQPASETFPDGFVELTLEHSAEHRYAFDKIDDLSPAIAPDDVTMNAADPVVRPQAGRRRAAGTVEAGYPAQAVPGRRPSAPAFGRRAQDRWH